jgi:hypothetical protein
MIIQKIKVHFHAPQVVRLSYLIHFPPFFVLFWVLDISPESANAKWMEQIPALVQSCKTGEEADWLISVLRRMLVIDPGERPLVREAMGLAKAYALWLGSDGSGGG